MSAASTYFNTAAAAESQPCPHCPQSNMHRQFSANDLYTQLSYFRYLFDHERQRSNLERKRASLVPCATALPLLSVAFDGCLPLQIQRCRG